MHTVSHMRTAPRNQGFTLIELLVVMAIIATLAGIGMVGIPAILRSADQTAAKDRLSSIYKLMMVYNTSHKQFPPSSGKAFVLAPWTSNILDHNKDEAEIFFDPTMTQPPEDLSTMAEPSSGTYITDWAGPDRTFGGRPPMRLSPTTRNASERVIICNDIREVTSEEDLDFLPHAGKGIVFLTLSGKADFMESSQFGDIGHPVIGPDSPVDKLKWMKTDEGGGQEDW